MEEIEMLLEEARNIQCASAAETGTQKRKNQELLSDKANCGKKIEEMASSFEMMNRTQEYVEAAVAVDVEKEKVTRIEKEQQEEMNASKNDFITGNKIHLKMFKKTGKLNRTDPTDGSIRELDGQNHQNGDDGKDEE